MAFLAPVIPYLMAAGTVVSAVGTIQQGQEANRQAKFQANQAELQAQEATIAGNIAATNANQGESDAMQQWQDARRQEARLMGQNTTAAGRSGLTLSGSIYDVNNDSALAFQHKANMDLVSGLNQAGNYRSESGSNMRSSNNLLTSAGNYRKSGRAALTSSYLSAGGQLMSGLGNSIDKASSRTTANRGLVSQYSTSSSIRDLPTGINPRIRVTA